MPTLPSQPNLDQLRHRARELLRAARAGDREASRRIAAVSEQVALTSAQLAIAREYGFASWAALKSDVQARTRTLAQAAQAFLTFSVNGRIGRAGRLLGEHPEIAGYDVRTAIALGDAERVRSELRRDPGLVARRDGDTGWTALHLVCASRWHVDPARTAGLTAIAELLLDAGADLQHPPASGSQWSPLRCAIASAGSGRGNEPIVELLLSRGARVADHDLYLAGFATGGDQWCVRLLARYTPDLRAIAEQALAAPISLDDVGGVRALLEAGADPRRYRNDDGEPAGAVAAAIEAGASPALIELLLAHGADSDQVGRDGRSVYAQALARGRGDLVELLARHGARDDATALDRLQYACLRGDGPRARELLGADPDLRAAVAHADGSALSHAAESGNHVGVALLLEAGFRAEAIGGSEGGTALHRAAWAGNAEAVTLLLAAGAPIDAQDSQWNSTALGWALEGSGQRPSTNVTADWPRTVRVLLDAGASTGQVALHPADETQPGPEVVELLRERGVLAAANEGA